MSIILSYIYLQFPEMAGMSKIVESLTEGYGMSSTHDKQSFIFGNIFVTFFLIFCKDFIPHHMSSIHHHRSS